MSSDDFDNLDAAMNAVADGLDPTVSSMIGSDPGSPANKQVLIRATTYDHGRWKEAADKYGMTLSDFIRTCCNERASDILDCPHPINERRFYPWSETCLRCGLRLRG
jgi:hypothetical protein